jgi:hypothetical protein
MSRSTLRNAVAAVVLAALLVPAAASAWQPSIPALSQEREHRLAGALWDFLSAVFLGEEMDNGWQIDPDGVTAPACGDPAGGGACATSDNGWAIDPNG